MLAGRRNKRPVLSPRRRCKRSLICERVRCSALQGLGPLRAMVTAGEGNVPGGKELSDKVMTHTNRWRFLLRRWDGRWGRGSFEAVESTNLMHLVENDFTGCKSLFLTLRRRFPVSNRPTARSTSPRARAVFPSKWIRSFQPSRAIRSAFISMVFYRPVSPIT